ncbi:ABC transporter permease [Actinoallomurus rhizosphaericola]|uniref:ABC transporter permease n=1 Tax=Actinoallomurus rhizosphaericola TaxID=2952536 RepID=UPI0020934E71|nr:ABC transporter permease [Actinoallomurus rhizosphaericola]
MSTISAGRPRAVLAIRRIQAIAIRHLLVTVRNWQRVFDIAVWPAVDTILYGSIATYAQHAPAGGPARTALSVVAGIVMWHLVYQAEIAVATGFFEESHSRQLPGLLVTPLRPLEWVLGTALQGMAKVVLGVTAVAGTAALLYGYDMFDPGPGIVPVMGLLLLNGWALALIVVALVLYFGAGSEGLTWGLLFVILPLSGAFYPVSALPAAVRPLSAVLPTSYTFAAARDVTAHSASAGTHIAIAALATVALVIVSVGFVTASLRTFQRRGFISRYQ